LDYPNLLDIKRIDELYDLVLYDLELGENIFKKMIENIDSPFLLYSLLSGSIKNKEISFLNFLLNSPKLNFKSLAMTFFESYKMSQRKEFIDMVYSHEKIKELEEFLIYGYFLNNESKYEDMFLIMFKYDFFKEILNDLDKEKFNKFAKKTNQKKINNF
jgi:hypothetical protein